MTVYINYLPNCLFLHKDRAGIFSLNSAVNAPLCRLSSRVNAAIAGRPSDLIRVRASVPFDGAPAETWTGTEPFGRSRLGLGERARVMCRVLCRGSALVLRSGGCGGCGYVSSPASVCPRALGLATPFSRSMHFALCVRKAMVPFQREREPRADCVCASDSTGKGHTKAVVLKVCSAYPLVLVHSKAF